MEIFEYQSNSNAPYTVMSYFEAAAKTMHGIAMDYSQRLEENYRTPNNSYDADVQYMVNCMMEFDYGDDIKASVKAAAIKAGELVLNYPNLRQVVEIWPDAPSYYGDLLPSFYKNFSQQMQVQINSAFSMWRNWGDVKRQTAFEIIERPQNINGKILKASISFPRNPSESYGFHRGRLLKKPIQYEHVILNAHPHNTATKNIFEWISDMIHENVHAVEEIERRAAQCVSDFAVASNIDAQLLLANQQHPQSELERILAFKAYEARPSERLARYAQDAFMSRINASVVPV